MNNRQGNMLESIRAVQHFLDLHADRLGEVNKTGVRQQLDEVVAGLTDHVTSQSDHALTGQGATRKQRELRRVLVADHMRPIARIATADLPATPEVQPLTMPAGRPTVARLIAAARGMATAAERYASVFTGAGLPADFVAQLTAATDALQAVRDEQFSSLSSRVGATDVLAETLQRGRRIVRVLDSLVAKSVYGDAELSAAWKSAKRIRQSSGAAAGTATTAMSGPTAPASETAKPGDAASAKPADAVSAKPTDVATAKPADANSVKPADAASTSEVAAAAPTANREPPTVA